MNTATHLSFEYQVLSLPVLEHIHFLQRADNVIGIDGCLLAHICPSTSSLTLQFCSHTVLCSMLNICFLCFTAVTASSCYGLLP